MKKIMILFIFLFSSKLSFAQDLFNNKTLKKHKIEFRPINGKLKQIVFAKDRFWGIGINNQVQISSFQAHNVNDAINANQVQINNKNSNSTDWD